MSKERLPETGWQNKVASVKQEPSALTTIGLILFKLFAIPTAIIGYVWIYDFFIATPNLDTTTITQKYVNHSGRTVGYDLYVKGHGLAIIVPRWFYDDCSLHDTVEISFSPIFKSPHQISLIHNGVVEAKTTLCGLVSILIVLGSFLPILMFVPSIRDRFGNASSVPYISGKTSPAPNNVMIVAAYFFAVFVCEFVAFCLFLSFVFDYDKPK